MSAPPTPPLPGPRLRLLGLPALISATGDESPLFDRDAALLAVLALEGAQPRRVLAAWLWPDKAGPQRSDSLRQRLMRLDARSGARLFDRQGSQVALREDVPHDLATGRTPGPSEPAPALLGELHCDDAPELADWLARARLRLRERWRADWAAQAEALEQQRQLAQALPFARRLVDDEPLHEHHWRRLMRLHYLRGDRSAAMAVHAALTQHLHRELGSLPSRETQALAAVVEQGAPLDPTPAQGPAGFSADRLAQLRRPTVLLQRQPQWQQMADAWRQGHSVLLLGEGGIGKSRLLDDFADAQGIALRIAARPGDARVPYTLLGRLLQERAQQALQLPEDTRAELARLHPALGPAAHGPLQPVRLARALGALLHDVPSIAIDDLHHADAASAELLPTLLEPPRLAVLASRPEGLPAALADWSADHHRVQTVRPTPLQTEAVAGLLAAVGLPLAPEAAWAHALARHTGGNPQLLLETLRALMQQPPAGPPPATLPVTAPMQQLVEQRLQALSAQARALARVSALAGGAFDVALAAHALALSVAGVLEPWQELQSAQVMNDRGFVHDLLAEAVRATIPAPVARALHERMAEHLQAQAAAPARCAQHWALAGMPARAALSHAAAARAAAAASRKDEEQRHWGAAAHAHQQAGQPEAAFDAEVAQAEALALGGQTDQSLQQARRLQASAANPAQQARASAALAHAMLHVADWAGAQQQALQAVRAVQAVSETFGPDLKVVHARALLMAGTAAAQLGRPEDSLPWVEQAERIAQPLCDDALNLGTLDLKAHVLDRVGRFAEAEQVVARAIALALAMGEHTERMNLLNNRASILGKLARLPEALDEVRQAAELGRRHDQLDGFQGLIVTMHTGLFSALCGDFTQALEALETAHAGLLRQGLQVPAWIAEHNLAFLWTVLGQVARAQRILSGPLDGLPRAVAVRRITLRARLARLCGGAAPAWPEDLLDESVERPVAMSARLERARADDDSAACRAVAAEASQMSLTSACFNARLGLVDTLARHDPSAAATEARHLWRDLQGHRPTDAWWPDVLHVLQHALRADGDHRTADALLQQAITWMAAARASLPAAFRASFDTRNRVHVALQTLARQAAGRPTHSTDATPQSRPEA